LAAVVQVQKTQKPAIQVDREEARLIRQTVPQVLPTKDFLVGMVLRPLPLVVQAQVAVAALVR
jgi:hypothetical protein